MDIYNKIHSDKNPLGQYMDFADGYFSFPKLEGPIKSKMIFNGQEVLTWSLNNYLGLANHPEVRKADTQATEKWGLAYPMGARMMSGQTALHEKLENELAKFENKEAAYLLNFGYQGMMSIIDTMLGRQDVVVYDSESHACIIDGMRMVLSKRYVYKHNDIDDLKKKLGLAQKLAEKQGGGILVITEGVFGMAGDLGKLDEIAALKKEFTFRLLVDDAHGFGTMGKTGAGAGEHFGIQEDIDIYFSTFAKSMACIGAFVASKKEVIDFLRYNMRSQIFAKSLPMSITEGLLKRLELIQTQPELKEKLWTIANALQKGLKEKGFNLGKTNSPVTPVYFSGSLMEGTSITKDLRENYKIFCSIVVYPVIPKGQLMLRIIPTAAHSLEDVEYTIKAFSDVAENFKKGKYKP